MPCEPFPRGPIKPAETVLKSKPLRRRGIAGPSALIRLASGPMRLTRISRLMSVADRSVWLDGCQRATSSCRICTAICTKNISSGSVRSDALILMVS